MKVAAIAAVMSLTIVFLLPLGMVKSEPLQTKHMGEEEGRPAETAEASEPEEEREPYLSDAETTVSLLDQGEVRTLALDKYLWGVTAAEMPASFEPEALKAQAVAARTYALRKRADGPSDAHPKAELCSDSGCCQAYCTQEEMAVKWGEDAQRYTAKIAEAVAATDGKVILYGGELIKALYHSSSGGYTEDAVAVWGSDVPYLRSVVSPEDSTSVPGYYSIQRVPSNEFRETFLAAFPAAKLEGSPGQWFQNLTRSRTGSVSSVDVGGVSIKGTELRALIGLRSAAFRSDVDGDDLVFSVIGYGHGVGMSQHGANVLAQSGMDYTQILSWYYKGTVVSDAASA